MPYCNSCDQWYRRPAGQEDKGCFACEEVRLLKDVVEALPDCSFHHCHNKATVVGANGKMYCSTCGGTGSHELPYATALRAYEASQ